MPSPLLARPIYTYADVCELLRLAEEFAARDRNNADSEDRPHCNTVCDDIDDVDERCKLCRLEGALADCRVLVMQYYDEASRSACNCPRVGGRLQHGPDCLVEIAAERCREMRRGA